MIGYFGVHSESPRIHDPQVLAGFSKCLEDMPSRPSSEVQSLLQGVGWLEVANGLGEAINAGTIAQVHKVSLQHACIEVMFGRCKRMRHGICRFCVSQRRLKLSNSKCYGISEMSSTTSPDP